MVEPHTERFKAALHALEEERDLEPLTSLFTDDAELRNPTDREPHRGRDGARRFWRAYRDSFDEIRSEFRAGAESDGTALLEWESRGRTSAGDEIRYEGVSVLEFEGERIRRFRTYFDTRNLGEQLEQTRH